MRRLFGVLLLSVVPVVGLCERLSVKAPGNLPGVDEEGMISEEEELGAMGPFKLSLNTKNGKLKESGKGQVTNLSNQNQTYNDPADFGLDNPQFGTVKVLYKVKANGAAKAKISSVVTDQEAIDALAEQIRMLGGH